MVWYLGIGFSDVIQTLKSPIAIYEAYITQLHIGWREEGEAEVES
jgi:hypothetical protein